MRARRPGLWPAEAEGLVEAIARALDGAALEVESGEGVDRFGRHHWMTVGQRDLAAPAAELAGGLGLVAEVVDHAVAAERLGQHVRLAGALRDAGGHFIAADRFLQGAGPFALPPLLQPSGCAGRPRETPRAEARARDPGSARHQYATAYLEK